LESVRANSSDDLVKLGVRKARKQAKDAFRKGLPEKLSKLHLQVAAKFGERSPVLKECFPSGRTAFAKSADDLLESHLLALAAGLTGREAELGTEPAADAEALRTNWLAVYSASESSSGVKSAAEKARREARLGLQLELFRNLLALAAQFPREPKQLDRFMRQSFLEDHPVKKSAPPPA